MQKSIILITVDCLRADHCGFMDYPRPNTPFLDELSKESFIFPAAIAAGVPTYYSLPAIIASRHALALGREVIGLSPDEPTLASVLKENGFATACFGAGNPYLSARFGYDHGFDTFRDFLDGSAHEADIEPERPPSLRLASRANRRIAEIASRSPVLTGIYEELYFQYCQSTRSPVSSFDTMRRFPSADVIVDQARSWLIANRNRPFFLWLHLMDPHAPYYPAEKALQLCESSRVSASEARNLNFFWARHNLGSDRLRRKRKQIVSLYDAGVRWVDEQIRRLAGFLRQFRLWDSCVLALTADHGEAFLEHERRFHAPALSEELIRVPLVLRVPGVRKIDVSEAAFSLLHLAPTLLEIADLPIPTSFQGRSHWPHIHDGTSWNSPALSECITGCTNPFELKQRFGARLLAVREARYKLVVDCLAGCEQLYDLQTDPGEYNPLPIHTASEARSRLLQAAFTHLWNTSTQEKTSSYLRARLRQLVIDLPRPLKNADYAIA